MKLRIPSVLLFVIYSGRVIGLWWSLETSLHQDPNVACRKTQSLFSRKGDFCKSKPQLISTVLMGMNTSAEECQWQFRNRRWNCSTTKNSVKKILRYDYRETAFIYAITSAGVTFSITHACSMGELQQCGCRKNSPKPHVHDNKVISVKQRARHDFPPNGVNSFPDQAFPMDDNSEFEWGGCGDNILYGYTMSKQLMENQARDGRSMIIEHNNEAGRLAVKRNMKKECKCHGLSGSCSVRTCWKKMPHFRDVGDRLKARFDGAIKVLIGNKGDRLIKDGETIKPPTEIDLVYTTDSPSFCKEDLSLGSHGTVGRQCNDTSMGVDGCELLCCGRGARMTKIHIVEHCQCRFLWCCRVKCKKCKTEMLVHTCE